MLYDQRGSLRSPAPDSTVRLDRLVADLEDLRRALELDRMTLLAHSMGNALAYAYFAAHPDRVRGLVLVAPVHPAPYTGDADMGFVREVWPEADSSALAAAADAFTESWKRRAYQHMEAEGLVPDSLRGADPQAIMDAHEDRNWTRAWRIAFGSVNSCTGDRWRAMQGGKAFYSQRVADAVMDDPAYGKQSAGFWPAIRDFEGPVEVLIGTCDYVDVGPLVWPHIAERLPNGRLVVLDGAGHNPWMDRPAAFESALAEALARATE